MRIQESARYCGLVKPVLPKRIARYIRNRRLTGWRLCEPCQPRRHRCGSSHHNKHGTDAAHGNMRWLGLFAPPHKKISLCHTDMRASDSWRNGNDISYNIGPEAESVLCPGISPVPDTCAVTRRQGSRKRRKQRNACPCLYVVLLHVKRLRDPLAGARRPSPQHSSYLTLRQSSQEHSYVVLYCVLCATYSA